MFFPENPIEFVGERKISKSELKKKTRPSFEGSYRNWDRNSEREEGWGHWMGAVRGQRGRAIWE